VGSFGRRFFLPITSHHKRYQVMDNFSHTFGKHDLKLGGELNSNGTTQVFIGFAGGVYNFDSLSDFKNRRPASFRQLFGINGHDAVESGTVPYFWQHEFGFYVQDNWRVNPRLTLNLGFRWDGVKNPQPQFTPIPGDQVALGRPVITGSGVTQRVGKVPQSIPNDYNNVAPRVGVAYDLTGSGKTIVRGGVGIYYGSIPTIFMAGVLSGMGLRGQDFTFLRCSASPPGQPCINDSTGVLTIGATTVKYPGKLPGQAPASLLPFLPPPPVVYADPDTEGARVLNIQVGVEHEIVRNFSVSASYSYNQSENLRIGGFNSAPYDRTLSPAGVTFDSFGRSIGPAAPGCTVGLAFCIQRLPQSINPVTGKPVISAAGALTTFGRARYHAFILQAKKTFSHNYQFGANYTLSKNEDNATSERDTDAFFGPSDPFNLELDYGTSQLDIRHQFSAYGYFLLPLKIEFSTFISARSGRAYPAYRGFCPGTGYQDGFQCSNFFISAIRPALKSGGLLPRFPFRNADFAQWDVRLGREFPIYERLKLRFTAEAFNLTNRSNAVSNTAGFSVNAVHCGGLSAECVPDLPLGPSFLDAPSPRGPIAGQFGLKFIF
jgi:outer membrane receptor protein involved in Fe transport